MSIILTYVIYVTHNYHAGKCRGCQYWFFSSQGSLTIILSSISAAHMYYLLHILCMVLFLSMTMHAAITRLCEILDSSWYTTWGYQLFHFRAWYPWGGKIINSSSLTLRGFTLMWLQIFVEKYSAYAGQAVGVIIAGIAIIIIIRHSNRYTMEL